MGDGSTRTHGGEGWRTEPARGRAVIRNHDANKELSRDHLFGRLYSKGREWDEDGGRGPEESGIVVPYGKW